MKNPAPPFLKSIIAVSVGVFFGGLAIFAIERLGHLIVPPPPGLDPNDPVSVASAMTQMPAAAFLVLFLAYLLGTSAGAWIAARLAPSHHFRHAAIVALFFIIGALFNFVSIPHPVWFVVVAMLAFAAAPFIGTRLAGRA